MSKKRVQLVPGLVLRGIASILVVTPLLWHYTAYHPRTVFFLRVFFGVCLVFFIFSVLVSLYEHVVKRLHLSGFWKKDVRKYVDVSFVLLGLFPLVLFLSSHIAELVFVGALIFLYTSFFAWLFLRHPDKNVRQIIITFSLIAIGVYAFNSIVQYMSFQYYILEVARDMKHAVLLRTLAMTSVEIAVLALVGAVDWKTRKIIPHTAMAWIVLLGGLFVFMVANTHVVYLSGLYSTPVAAQHAEGAEYIFLEQVLTLRMLFFCIFVLVLFFLTRAYSKVYKKSTSRFWFAAQIGVIIAGVFSLFGIQAISSTPEFVTARTFSRYFAGDEIGLELSPQLQQKLERFGIAYDMEEFHLVNRDQVYTTATEYLPEQFEERGPNILIFFVESLSTRFTSVYNGDFEGITPGFQAMADHPDTTVFHNFYNASTPTAPGLLSLLCSHYPTTSHLEISQNGELSGHRLLCLPEVLKEHGGYGHATYFATVEKTYGAKDRMFRDMGADEVLGKDELKAYIAEDPASWGYTDHQITPAFRQFVERWHAEESQPFLAMLSTNDSHLPFTFPPDGVMYDEGAPKIINTYHTADHAFLEFWQWFQASELVNDTMVVVVADQSPFPSQPVREVFPDIPDTSYYDENVFMVYMPESQLPKEVRVHGSGVDFTPTLLHVLGINIPNSFEGYSLFGARKDFPHVLGTQDLGIYINELLSDGSRGEQFILPGALECPGDGTQEIVPGDPLTLCELGHFYFWKKEQFRKGRFWKHEVPK